jgi:type IV secretory pathway VirB10-like protein
MDEMEKLLAQLKTEYEQNEQPQPISPIVPPVSELKPTTKPTSPLDSLLAEVKADVASVDSCPPPLTNQPVSLPENPVLQEMKIQYREDQEKERLEKQRQEEQRQQRKKQALRQQAQEWLKKLNPRSEEGRWFEEFSYSYESKLEAAIHYLEALRETHS